MVRGEFEEWFSISRIGLIINNLIHSIFFVFARSSFALILLLHENVDNKITILIEEISQGHNL